MAKKEVDTFIEKVEQKGYAASLRVDLEKVIISKENYYHVAINLRMIFEAPFDYIMEHVEREIEGLKNAFE